MFKKIVAFTVIVAFFSLIGASAYPLQAQEQPGAVEKPGTPAATVQKSSILPIVLIGVGVLAVAAVLIFVVFKTSYDITGSWVLVLAGSGDHTFQANFSGTKESGNWIFATHPSSGGTYTVSGSAVTMTYTGTQSVINGTFTDKDTMSGTWVDGSYHYTWTGTRGTLTATTTPQQGSTGKPLTE
jgi:hypothetical protein